VTAEGWQALAAMMTVPGLGQWQVWAVTVTGSQGSPEFYCATWFEGVCEDCGDLPNPPCEDGEQVAVNWLLAGATPEEWSTLGTIDSSGWSGDTSGMIDGDYSGATRGANEPWAKSTLPNNPAPDDNTKMGIKYTFDEPTGVSHLVWSFQANSSFSKIMHVALKLEDDSMVIVDAIRDQFPSLNTLTRDVIIECQVAKEVWFMAVTGAHGIDQQALITLLTQIN